MTGLATFLSGCVPTYEQIGVWGAVILTVLRFIQGVGVGGEWGGSVLLSMEWAQRTKIAVSSRRGRNLAVPAGLFLANLAVLAFSAISGDQFLAWGWRVPFLLSIIMVGIGLWIRLGILETPTFRRLLAEERVERAPVARGHQAPPEGGHPHGARAHGEAGARLCLYRLRLHLWHASCCSLTRSPAHGAADRARSAFFTIPFFGLSVGSHRAQAHLHLIGAVATGLFGFVYFALLNTAVPDWIFFAHRCSLLLPHDMMYGPQAALIAECFHPAAALQRRLARLSSSPRSFAGGPAPLIATALLAAIGLGLCHRVLHPRLRRSSASSRRPSCRATVIWTLRGITPELPAARPVPSFSLPLGS